jgi:hypothetical protein
VNLKRKKGILKVPKSTILVVDFFENQEKCTKCLYIGENPLFQLVLFLSKMCVKCRIWLKKYKIYLGGRACHFHLGYCFLIWASSLKISVAQLAIMHKKLIWDPGTFLCSLH